MNDLALEQYLREIEEEKQQSATARMATAASPSDDVWLLKGTVRFLDGEAAKLRVEVSKLREDLEKVKLELTVLKAREDNRSESLGLHFPRIIALEEDVARLRSRSTNYSPPRSTGHTPTVM
jgi:chromosome segregation ATPase